MPRIIHLHPAHPNFQTRRSIDLLAKSLAGEFPPTLHSLGFGGDFHNFPAALLSLRAARGQGYNLIHAWGARELLAAAMAGFSRIVFSPPAPLPIRFFDWMGRILLRRDVQFVLPTEAMRRHICHRDVPERQCHLIRPPVEPHRLPAARDPALRRALGLADSDIVLLAPGESARLAAHRDAVWCTGILNVLDPRYRIVTWGRGPQSAALTRFAARLRQPEMLVQAQSHLGREIEFESLTKIADAALVFSRDPASILSVGLCMAAALPIVSRRSPALDEILLDNRSALTVPRATPKILAQRVLDLRADAALAARIAEQARADALATFSAAAFIDAHRQLYSGNPVTAATSPLLPQPAP